MGAEPVAGRIALLSGTDSFRAYDYIRSVAAKDPNAPRISEATWRRALEPRIPVRHSASGWLLELRRGPGTRKPL